MPTWTRLVIALVLAGGAMAGVYMAFSGEDSPEAAPPVPETVIEEPTRDTTAVPTKTAPQPEPTATIHERELPIGAGSIRGHVIGANPDRPLVVRVQQVLPEATPPRVVPESRHERTLSASDPFSFEALPLGWYSITADDGERTCFATAHLREGKVSAELTLTLTLETESIRGRVVNEAGTGLPGVTVRPVRAVNSDRTGDHALRAIAATTTTDATGHFVLDALPIEEWRIAATAPGYAPLFHAVTDTDEEQTLVLLAGVEIRGLLTTADPDIGVGDVVVRLRGAGDHRNEQYEATTDESGSFLFAAVRGDALLWPSIEHEALALAIDPIELLAREQVDLLELPVATGGVLAGRVFDAKTERGQPGVTVKAARPHFHRKVITDAKGHYRLTGLPAGPYVITWEAVEGYPEPQWKDRIEAPVALGSVLEGLDFPLLRGLQISGRVVDRDGQPIPTGVVTFGAMPRHVEVKVAHDGSFESFGWQALQSVEISAFGDGYALAERPPLQLGHDDVLDLELQLIPESSLAGIVRDATGRPLARVEVHAHRTDARIWGNRPAVTDDEGFFRVGKITAGTYNIGLVKQGSWGAWQEGPQGIRVGAEQHVTGLEIDFEENGALTITGRVLDSARQPVKGAYVNCWGDAGNGGCQSTGDGYFEIKGLREGSCTVTTHAEGFGQKRQKTEAGTRDLEVVLQENGSIEGRIVDDASGAPVTAFRILAMQGKKQRRQPWSEMNLAHNRNADGIFRLANVPTGEATILVLADGYADHFESISLTPGELRENVELRLKQGDILEGVVLDSQGRPVAGAGISLGGDSSMRFMGAQVPVDTRSDEAGHFSLARVSATTDKISIQHPEFVTKRVTIDPANLPERLTVTLEPEGKLRGRILVGGEPLAGAWVWTEATEGGTSDSNGEYEVRGLPAGTATVHAYVHSADRSRQQEQKVEIRSGETSTLDFDFPVANATIRGRVLGEDLDLTKLRLQMTLGGEDFSTRLDAEGGFEFKAVPAGTAAITITDRSGPIPITRSEKVEFEIANNETIERDIHLRPGAVLTGKITGVGEKDFVYAAAITGEHNFTSLTPELFETIQSDVAAVLEVAEDRTYRLQGLQEGKYTVIVVSFPKRPTDLMDLIRARFVSKVLSVGETEERNVDLHIP